MFEVNITWTNKNPNTIWNKLVSKLGRNPTNDECKAEIFRIIDAAKGGKS